MPKLLLNTTSKDKQGTTQNKTVHCKDCFPLGKRLSNSWYSVQKNDEGGTSVTRLEGYALTSKHMSSRVRLV